MDRLPPQRPGDRGRPAIRPVARRDPRSTRGCLEGEAAFGAPCASFRTRVRTSAASKRGGATGNSGRISADADIVFLGLQEPEHGGESAYADRIIELAEGLNTCIFVRSAGEFAGRLV